MNSCILAVCRIARRMIWSAWCRMPMARILSTWNMGCVRIARNLWRWLWLIKRDNSIYRALNIIQGTELHLAVKLELGWQYSIRYQDKLAEETAAPFLYIILHLVASRNSQHDVAIRHRAIAKTGNIRNQFLAVHHQTAQIFVGAGVVGTSAPLLMPWYGCHRIGCCLPEWAFEVLDLLWRYSLCWRWGSCQLDGRYNKWTFVQVFSSFESFMQNNYSM